MTSETAPSASSSGSTATQRRTAATPSNNESPPSNTAHAPPPTAVPIMPLRLLAKLIHILAILLRVTLYPLSKAVNSILFPLKEYDGIHNGPAADRAARSFVSAMKLRISAETNHREERYAEPACPFVERGYDSILSTVFHRETTNTTPLLLIYIHSPLHRKASEFLGDYLCHGPLLELLNSNNHNASSTAEGEGNIVCFGTNVHTADGERLRQMFDVTSFPFLALLHIKNTSSTARNHPPEMELLLRLEGESILSSIPPSQITTYISASLSHHVRRTAEALAARLAREEEIRLRREQDREYQEALSADRIREAERREEEERLRREEEERAETERSTRAREEERLERARGRMAKCTEPESGGVKIRFTLPDGKKVDRRFRNGESLEVLRAFLTVHFHEEGYEIKNIGLSTNFPRRTFGEEENGLSLEEAGLCPQAVVMVQDLDA